ncbi:biotin-independent malonate decarboxylase subunit beta [Salinisphaera japonica]|uniref:Malonate decarboxylase subunit beta n=1 Tax=Salinisphaera japonica YTM-1 TaxID=1209778 RepID=A0A423PRI2_9GAMM|nr:biotin-independent malonate decarboxylase subunit beta [Salinisphaera japonica]ROO28131.1 malonate decarboxylase subunit beta [Salinisphaera japonica YTM-1]
MRDVAALLQRQSFVELPARARCQHLLDDAGQRELLGPFERLTSPWLPKQNIVTQSDDGVVIMRGTLGDTKVVVAAVEPAFQGGSMGEVGGAKIAGALTCALADVKAGDPVVPILLLETGGVRLQEANCGLAAIAEIHDMIVALREHGPVIGVITGPVGCFGGMSIAAGLCSALLVTREARLGLNGPQVIEQEAGVDEFDSRDRPMIWSLLGGEQRVATGLAEDLVDDDVAAIRDLLAERVTAAPKTLARTTDIARFEALLETVDPAEQATAETTRAMFDQTTGAA